MNAVRNNFGSKPIHLICKYFPFARQDRMCNIGESFSLQAIAQIINMLDFERITVWDPHSDVLAGMFPAGVLDVIPQHELVVDTITGIYLFDLIIAPDAGAVKKASKLANWLNRPLAVATKVRNTSNGSILGVSIKADFENAKRILVVDDICDGGATFIALGECIRKKYFGLLALFTTHAIYSKGKEELAKYYDTIQTANYIGKN